MQLKTVVIASVLIGICLGIVPMLMVLNQWAHNKDAYGIDINDQRQLRFTWQDVEQQSHQFPASAGQYTYLFLGFLSCSEICPIRVQQMIQLEQHIQQDALLTGTEVQFMFVTIDPQNDTPAVRKSVVDDRSPRFVSASLSDDELQRLDRQLSENINQELRSINHVGKLFLVSPEGQVARIYTAKHLSTQKMQIELKHIMSSES
ncbi:SCO family protein [Shewanella basaltis]|jgi:cytochrome oxidase Cu insertion factor (SCO1/SenC/PrrC family)|uniref:SCO family protein n=1 Tax=Shewanella basaltis TaxID=472183 RepID=UPI002010BDBB|nr:SCO family protein [Shewanella basaltis]MCL1112103.1 SCO family protein [Shewanella basaltis]